MCNRLKEWGLEWISLDKLSHEAVNPGSGAYDKIVNHFGNSILEGDGFLNRRRLRRIIVRDENARRKLEGFIHPEVLKNMRNRIKLAEVTGAEAVIIEVPLLFELGIENQFDVVIAVSTDRECRIRRVMDRDGVNRVQAEALLMTQMPDEEKCRRADFVIMNNHSIDDMINSVDGFYRDFCQKYVRKHGKPLT